MNLLIVDDDMIAVKGLMASVRWEDYGIHGVEIAYGAERALEILRTGNMDIMLCDIEMPRQSGIELVRRIKEEHIEVEIIFLTCHAKFEYAQEAIRLGCENYLLRPMPFEDIASAVHSCAKMLEIRRRDAELKEYGAQWIHTQMVQADQAQKKKTPRDIVEDVEGFVMENISNEDLSVSMVASHCYLNQDYLNRIFKQVRGVSISRYITDYRLKVAAYMLEKGTLTAAVVAEKAGYKNYSYFSTQFKKMYGCMPSEYRKQFVNKKGNGEDGQSDEN